MSFNGLLTIREETVDNKGPWMWVKSDNGAWDGPKKDWETSHKFIYMKHLKDTSAVITAGANCGMYARQYADLFAVVWAFEPDPLNFHCLVNNCQLTNVIKIQAILGSHSGVASLNINDMTNVGMHTVNESPEIGFIPMMTIDSLNVNKCSLIQLDVEGYEYNVLLGAVETIKKFKPVISVERGETPQIRELLIPLRYQKVDQSISDTIWAFVG